MDTGGLFWNRTCLYFRVRGREVNNIDTGSLLMFPCTIVFPLFDVETK